MGNYNPIGEPGLDELAATGVNANASSVTSSFATHGHRNIIFHVVANTGAHTTHVLTLQCSLDDSEWFDIAGATITGVGVKGGITINSEYVRLKVTTLEGGTSTVDIIIQAK